jgi:hypothetical protein
MHRRTLFKCLAAIPVVAERGIADVGKRRMECGWIRPVGMTWDGR